MFVRVLVLAAATGPLAGCWTYDTVLTEFDSVAGYDDVQGREPDKLEYRSVARRHTWLIRQLEGIGVGSLVNRLLAFRREQVPVDDPSGFARARIEQLASVAGNDLDRLCEAACRLLLVIEKDAHVLNRAVAVEVLGELGEVFRAERLRPDEPGLTLDLDAPSVFKRRSLELLRTLDASWPDASRKQRTKETRDVFATALRDLSRLDPGSLVLERSRLRAVTEAMLDERDPELRKFTARFLLRCLQTATSRGLAAGLRDPHPHVRETAVRRLWRLGRGGILPWIFDQLAARNKRAPVPGSRLLVDSSIDVRRRLVHLAWALDRETAAKTLGDDKSDGKSALAFLVETAMHDPERSLQLAAGEALAFLVRRPVDPSGAWIREWWQGFVTQQRSSRP